MTAKKIIVVFGATGARYLYVGFLLLGKYDLFWDGDQEGS